MVALKMMPYLDPVSASRWSYKWHPFQKVTGFPFCRGTRIFMGHLAGFLSGSLLLINVLEILSLVHKKDCKACTINLLVLIQWLSCAKPFYCYQYPINTKQSQSTMIFWNNLWVMHNAEEALIDNISKITADVQP